MVVSSLGITWLVCWLSYQWLLVFWAHRVACSTCGMIMIFHFCCDRRFCGLETSVRELMLAALMVGLHVCIYILHWFPWCSFLYVHLCLDHIHFMLLLSLSLLCVSVSLFLSLSVCLSFCACLPACLSVCLSVSLCVCLCLCLSLSLCFVSICLSVCLSVSLSVSFCAYLCLSLSLFLKVPYVETPELSQVLSFKPGISRIYPHMFHLLPGILLYYIFYLLNWFDFIVFPTRAPIV